MTLEPDLSTIAALIGDPARATILSALMGGQALPASELAYRAHVTPQTTSAHLSKLVEGGLLSVATVGRHRYYQLKSVDVARVLEALALISPPPRIRSQAESAEMQALRLARTCYDHLAGKLGVAITQALLDKNWLVQIDQNYQITEPGAVWLAAWQIDEQELRKGRRRFACVCIDWSERRPHVGGGLGAAIATRLFEQGWVIRIPDVRAVRLTETGRLALERELSIHLKELL